MLNRACRLFIFTLASGETIRESQAHEAERRIARLNALGVSYSLAEVTR